MWPYPNYSKRYTARHHYWPNIWTLFGSLKSNSILHLKEMKACVITMRQIEKNQDIERPEMEIITTPSLKATENPRIK